MAITLNDLIQKEIFQTYDILSGSNALNKEIKSVSILETPDFERYIIQDSIILTTFYPIRNEIELATQLLRTLKKNNTAGIIIKVHRYVDLLPQSFIDLAIELEIPIVTLNYDANLSVLFNNIISEIQITDFADVSLEKSYVSILQKVYANPTTENLMEAVSSIDNIELLIENIETKSVKYTNKDVYDYYLKYPNSSTLIQRLNQDIYYVETVIYGDKPIYKMVFLARNDRRHIIHNTIEIFRLLVIVVYQKKQELMRKQNAFLMNFVSGITKDFSNEDISRTVREFQWNLNFPIMFVILSDESFKDLSYDSLFIQYSKSVIINKWHVKNDELRFAQLDKLLLFIINIAPETRYENQVIEFDKLITNKFPEMHLNLAYSNPIFDVQEIANTYHLMQQALSNLKYHDVPKHIFDENDLRLFDLLRNVEPANLQHYINDVFAILKKRPDSEQKVLLKTLYVYIENQFNIKNTALELYVHYNTVRYRLEQLDELGLMPNHHNSYFKIYFALYLSNQLNPL